MTIKPPVRKSARRMLGAIVLLALAMAWRPIAARCQTEASSPDKQEPAAQIDSEAIDEEEGPSAAAEGAAAEESAAEAKPGRAASAPTGMGPASRPASAEVQKAPAGMAVPMKEPATKPSFMEAIEAQGSLPPSTQPLRPPATKPVFGEVKEGLPAVFPPAKEAPAKPTPPETPTGIKESAAPFGAPVGQMEKPAAKPASAEAREAPAGAAAPMKETTPKPAVQEIKEGLEASALWPPVEAKETAPTGLAPGPEAASAASQAAPAARRPAPSAPRPAPKPAFETKKKKNYWKEIPKTVLWYVPNRLQDLLDVPRLSVAEGPSVALSLRATRFVSASMTELNCQRLGAMEPRPENYTRLTIWGLLKSMLKADSISSESGEAGNWFTRVVLRKVLRLHDVYDFLSYMHQRQHWGYIKPDIVKNDCGIRFFGAEFRRTEYESTPRPKWEVAADAHVMLGARVGFGLDDAVDFALGFIGCDFQGDDKGMAWGRHIKKEPQFSAPRKP